MIKGKEFDELFKVKATEFCQVLSGVSQQKGYVVHDANIEKIHDFVYGFHLFVTMKGMRMLPMRLTYTVMYDPKTEKYTWHKGPPVFKEEKVLN